MLNPKQAATKTKIIALLGSGMNHTDIAKTLGCSTKTVQRVSTSIRPVLAEVKDLISEYRRLLRERLPIEERVGLYEKIARKVDRNPFAAMRALERVDDLDGILTAKDEIKRPQEGSRENQPMFTLPPGTSIQVNITAPDQAIDVTPNKNPEEQLK